MADGLPAPRGAVALPLGIRNRLAELILEAFDEPGARRTLEALVAFCRSADGAVGLEGAARLAATGWFEDGETGRVRLLGAHRPTCDALCRRATAAAALFADPGALPEGDSLPGLLARVALLADAGLYFEVHELIEPGWMRAEGTERVALQALIQVAVAFHHAQSGNREGAISLLTEGLAKLEVTRSVLPLDAATWGTELAGTLSALRGGATGLPAPAWPRPQGDVPRETAWRSS